MPVAQLGLQPGAPAGLGLGQEVLAIGVQARRQAVFGAVLGHAAQALVHHALEGRLAGKMQRVDVDQRAILALAAVRAHLAEVLAHGNGRLVAAGPQLAAGEGQREQQRGEGEAGVKHGHARILRLFEPGRSFLVAGGRSSLGRRLVGGGCSSRRCALGSSSMRGRRCTAFDHSESS